MQGTVNKQQPRESLSSASPAFTSLPENNLMNVIKVRKLQLLCKSFFVYFFEGKKGTLIQLWACFLSRCCAGVSAPHSAEIAAGLLQASVSFLPDFHQLLSIPGASLFQCGSLSGFFAPSYKRKVSGCSSGTGSWYWLLYFMLPLCQCSSQRRMVSPCAAEGE